MGFHTPQRIDHQNARLPYPTKALLDSVAKELYEYMRPLYNDVLADDQKLPEWANTPELLRDNWVGAARVAYATIAVIGGAKRTVIPAQDDCR